MAPRGSAGKVLEVAPGGDPGPRRPEELAGHVKDGGGDADIAVDGVFLFRGGWREGGDGGGGGVRRERRRRERKTQKKGFSKRKTKKHLSPELSPGKQPLDLPGALHLLVDPHGRARPVAEPVEAGVEEDVRALEVVRGGRVVGVFEAAGVADVAPAVELFLFFFVFFVFFVFILI